MFLDYLETGKTSAIGTCTGAIAGLAAITPAAGSVGPLGGIIIGTLSAIICRFFSTTVKEKVGYDDSLDVVGVHGVGGFVGTLALAFFGAPMFGGFSTVPMMEQFGIQLAAAVGVALYTAVASFVCLKITGVITGGIRVAEEVESSPEGLDGYSHGEAAYTLEEGELQRATVPALA